MATPPTADHAVSPFAEGKERDEHGHHREPDDRVRAQAAERIVKPAMPAIEPTMSMAYALSGGMRRSSGPSGRARVAMTAVTRATTSGRTRKLTSAALLSARPKKSSSCDWTWTLSWATKTSATTAKSSDAKGDERRPPALAAEQDAEADAQEAGHQQEVAEEADVADVGRDPADEQQLDEEERRAGQEEPDAWIGQCPRLERGVRGADGYAARRARDADAPSPGGGGRRHGQADRLQPALGIDRRSHPSPAAVTACR